VLFIHVGDVARSWKRNLQTNFMLSST